MVDGLGKMGLGWRQVGGWRRVRGWRWVRRDGFGWEMNLGEGVAFVKGDGLEAGDCN